MIWEPEPETIESIKAQGHQGSTPSVYRCGCEYRKRWHLCPWHDGFEAGLEAARPFTTPDQVDCPNG